MKKVFLFFCLILTGCFSAPKDVFEEKLSGGSVYQLPVGKIEVVDFKVHHDSKHYIENTWPQTPAQVIQNWVNQNLKTTPFTSERLIVVIHQAHVVQEPLKATHWFYPDREKDTLSFRVEFIMKENTKTKQTFTVGGEAFVEMTAKKSLAEKETQWANMLLQMRETLALKLQEKLPHVVKIQSPSY